MFDIHSSHHFSFESFRREKVSQNSSTKNHLEKPPKMFKKVKTAVNNWWLRYILSIELYTVEPWERYIMRKFE